MDRERAQAGDWLAWIGFGALVMFFLVLKAYSLHWQVGDENIYFYMAWSTAHLGALPYADYFFAHPPLHLLPGVPVFGLLGFNLLTARVIPVGATLIGALFLFLLARRRMGPLAAVATVALYLSAFSLLRASTHWTGINLSVMWLVIGLWALFSERPVWSGVCLALGVCTGTYVLPAAVMTGLLAVLHSGRRGLRFLIGFAVPWGVIQLLGLILAGGDYIDAVYRYHFQKPDKPGVARDMFVRVFGDNFALWLGTLLGPILAGLDRWAARHSGLQRPEERAADDPGGSWIPRLWRFMRRLLWQEGERGLARVGFLWAVGYSLFIGRLPRVFPFYFLLMFPPMALAGGFAVDRFSRHGLAWIGRAIRRERKHGSFVLVWLALVLAVAVGYVIRAPVQQALLPDYVRKSDKPMSWSDAPLPGVVNRLLRFCCWDDVARKFTSYGTVQEVLYHESRYFDVAEELAEVVRKNTTPDQTLFGDSSTAGLVALLSGRRLAAQFADTNTMRFTSGITPPSEALRRIEAPGERPEFVIVEGLPVRDSRGQVRFRYGKFAGLRPFREWLDEQFEVFHKVRDRTKGWYLLLRRKTAPEKSGSP